MDSQITHPTYQIVDESHADALAWVFTDSDTMKKIAIKFPELKPHEARAKITYTGLCHTDVHTVKNEWGPCPFPLVPGHEIVGEITHVGSEVKDFKVGDKVGFGAQRDCCDSCRFCKMDCEQFCNGEVDQLWTYYDKYWGGYATAIQHPAKFFFKLPENLPENRIPPLFCAGGSSYSAVSNYAKSGQDVAIVGIGGVGHLAVQFAKAWGCNVTAFTSSKEKEESVKALGADRVVVRTDEELEKEAGKFDLVINTLSVGDQFNSLVSLVKPFGTFCQLGIPSFGEPSSFNPGLIVFSHVKFVSSLIASRKEIRDMLEFASKHNIVPKCEHFDFEEFPKAYDRLVNGRPEFRCVVDVSKVAKNQK